MLIIYLALMVIVTLLALLIVIVPLVKYKAYWTASFIALSLPIVTSGLYYHWGAGPELINYWSYQRQAQQVKAEMANIKSPQQVIDKLKAHLHQHPHSPKGWYLLGHLYLTLGQYSEAEKALGVAYQQNSEKIRYTTTYAEAIFFNHERHLSPQAKKLLLNVLEKQPNNIDANNLLAINAYNGRDYQQAIHYWEKIAPLFPPGSEDSDTILKMIAKAQSKIVSSLFPSS